MNTWITIKEAAASLGVSPSTFKRLCDLYSISLERSPGGHRRVDRSAVQLLERAMLKAGGRHQHGLGDVPSVDHCLEKLLANRPRQLANSIMNSATSLENLIECIESSLVAALWRVGEQCSGDQLDVFEACIATNTALSTLDFLYELVVDSVPIQQVAVGGSLAPGYDTIPSKLVALALSTIGCRTVDLGAALPVEVLARAAFKLGAGIVWTTNTHVSDPQATVRSHESLRDLLPPGTQVLIGGGGISPSVRRSLSWCDYYETCSELVRTFVLSK